MPSKRPLHTQNDDIFEATTSTGDTTFADLELEPTLLRAVTEMGYISPTPIQQQAIPLLLQGRDVMGQAQTGTGKTAAFGLPLLQAIDPSKPFVQALVLTPTRELALQVAENLHAYAKHRGRLQVLPIYGGASMTQQLSQLQKGVHVVVGTPGRVMDHLRRGSLVLDQAKWVVLDEADEMLKMGFFEDVSWILEQTPSQKQTALFSATFPVAIQTLGKQYMSDPVYLRIQKNTATVDTIEQRCLHVTESQKVDALTKILEVEPIETVLVFTRTKLGASHLADTLVGLGYRAESLHSDLSQAERQKVLRRLQVRQSEIVVATDVAARGLDVQHISHVVNYDMPGDAEVYTHRIGRTGRAGKSGISILFVSPKDRHMLRQIERFTKKTIEPMSLPSPKLVQKRKAEKRAQEILAVLKGDLQEGLSMVSHMMEQYEEEPVRIAAAAFQLFVGKQPGTSFSSQAPKKAKSSASHQDGYWPQALSSSKEGLDERGSDLRTARATVKPKRGSDLRTARATVKPKRDSDLRTARATVKPKRDSEPFWKKTIPTESSEMRGRKKSSSFEAKSSLEEGPRWIERKSIWDENSFAEAQAPARPKKRTFSEHSFGSKGTRPAGKHRGAPRREGARPAGRTSGKKR